IYAFGCVLYEMSTGARVGSSQRRRIGSRKLAGIVNRCLEKDPGRRWQTAAELQRELAAASPVRRGAPLRLPAILLGAVVLLAAAGGFWWLKRSAASPARSEWVQITNFADSVSQPALSPDGRMLAFIRGPNTFNGPGQIYIKLLPSGEPVQLTRDDAGKMS